MPYQQVPGQLFHDVPRKDPTLRKAEAGFTTSRKVKAKTSRKCSFSVSVVIKKVRPKAKSGDLTE